jgi:hypothetical protein
MFGAEHGSDASTGVVAVRDQKINRSLYSDGRGPSDVEESISLFASPDEAEAELVCPGRRLIARCAEQPWRANGGRRGCRNGV